MTLATEGRAGAQYAETMDIWGSVPWSPPVKIFKIIEDGIFKSSPQRPLCPFEKDILRPGVSVQRNQAFRTYGVR